MSRSAPARLAGLTAVVTGGNSGLGFGLARGLGAAGARVVLWARNEEHNRAAVEALARQDVDATAVTCDVTVEDDVAAALATTVAHAGRVDCLVANAGIAARARLVDTTLEDWQRVLRTNLDGTFLTTRAAAQHMIGRGGGGSLVVVASLAARYGAAEQLAYATSKTGLVGLTRTLAVELARHRIRCNALLPGWTETPMNEELRRSATFVRATVQRTPVRRWAQPDDFHEIAAFLADPSLTYHTGDEVLVDGGYSVF